MGKGCIARGHRPVAVPAGTRSRNLMHQTADLVHEMKIDFYTVSGPVRMREETLLETFPRGGPHSTHPPPGSCVRRLAGSGGAGPARAGPAR
eukprot:COSAG01_NODE_1406_length_10435_cov_24.133017_2_plen_92_part_00